MQINIVNNSGTHANNAIYVCLLGQDAHGNYGYLDLSTAGDTLGFIPATGISSSNAVTVPSYTLDALSSMPNLSDYVNSGRGYVSINQTLDIPIWSSGYVGPDYMVDTNKTFFDFFEFYFDPDPGGTTNCNADLSPLDWVSIPMSLQFDDASGNTVAGPVGFDVERYDLFSAFDTDATLKNLIVPGTSLGQIRILAPGHGITNGLFSSSYLDDYIDTVWTHYAQPGNTLVLNVSPVNGEIYTGQVNASGAFAFTDKSGAMASSICKPTTQDVFLCNGVFNGVGSGAAFLIDANIKNQVVSALNRGILPLAGTATLCDSTNFYVTTQSNKGKFNSFSQLLHENSSDGLCYGFAYDDQCDQSTDISVDNPVIMTVIILLFGELE